MYTLASTPKKCARVMSPFHCLLVIFFLLSMSTTAPATTAIHGHSSHLTTAALSLDSHTSSLRSQEQTTTTATTSMTVMKMRLAKSWASAQSHLETFFTFHFSHNPTLPLQCARRTTTSTGMATITLWSPSLILTQAYACVRDQACFFYSFSRQCCRAHAHLPLLQLNPRLHLATHAPYLMGLTSPTAASPHAPQGSQVPATASTRQRQR
ncbi:hypothetical protein EDB86DRAFT_2932071 [Lactarius hatsudake]|nr:hypothetical protein EDB86DRAFT_2932071 [Lactarius hatsudake]